MAHSTDIVAYQYKAELWAPEAILNALPTGPGQEYDGWADLSGQPVEDSLSELAAAFQIDREDESSFDSDEFPKVVFRDQLGEDEPLRGRDY